MKKISSNEVALSAVSCGFATLFLTAGCLLDVFLFTGYLLACVAIMIPLTQKSYVGALLSALGATGLTLIFIGFRFWDLLPFILFFGLHPIVNALQIKWRINKYVALVIKAVWFDGIMFFIWKFLFEMETSFAFVDKYFIPILLVGGTLFFFFYDYTVFTVQQKMNYIVNKIIRKKK